MSAVIVGVSDCRISDDAEAVLWTYALGSCIAIAAHDPVAKLAGLLHFMLPEASIDAAKASRNPFMFADTGISTLLSAICERGGNRRRLQVQIAGGAQVIEGHELFQIGRRNYLAAKKLLWKEGILAAAEAVGGDISRTVRLEVGSGRAFVRAGGVETALGRAEGVRSQNKAPHSKS